MSGELHNEPQDNNERLLALYIKRLIEKADDPEIKASMLAEIGRYLSAAGMIDRAPTKPGALSPEVFEKLPFPATDDEPPKPTFTLPPGAKLPF